MKKLFLVCAAVAVGSMNATLPGVETLKSLVAKAEKTAARVPGGHGVAAALKDGLSIGAAMALVVGLQDNGVLAALDKVPGYAKLEAGTVLPGVAGLATMRAVNTTLPDSNNAALTRVDKAAYYVTLLAVAAAALKGSTYVLSSLANASASK